MYMYIPTATYTDFRLWEPTRKELFVVELSRFDLKNVISPALIVTRPQRMNRIQLPDPESDVIWVGLKLNIQEALQ
jgi:hypothetical protein